MLEKQTESGLYYYDESSQIDDSAVIGEETKIWNEARIFRNAIIGKYCVIGAGVHIESDVSIGDFSKVQRGVTLYSGVKAEDYVFFGPNATTTNDRNPRAFGSWDKAEAFVETGASIGANSTIVAGNRIGALSLIGAGAVVTKDVAPGQLVVGNPARFAGWVDVSGKVISKDETKIPNEVEKMIEDPKLSIEQYLNELN